MGSQDLSPEARFQRYAAQIRAMLAMAFANGTCTEEEFAVITRRLGELGVTPEEFSALPHNTSMVEGPTNRADRIRIVLETALVMFADGEVDRDEASLFMKLAHAMNIGKDEGRELARHAGELTAKSQRGEDITADIERICQASESTASS